MSNNSDPLFEKFKDCDFTDAKPVSDMPALAKLQAEQAGKTRITIRFDNEVLDWFRQRAEQAGNGNYQTLMNEALKDYIRQHDLEGLIRRIIREELHAA
jgi:uncharacterized protein (DUF4415 family)